MAKVKKSNVTDTKDAELSKELTKLLIQNEYSIGNLTEEDLTDETKLKEKLKSLLVKINKAEFSFIIDHRSDMLEEAFFLARNKKYNYAKILYATFFEHAINNIVDFQCGKKKIDGKSKVEIIRNVNLAGKLTWLLKLLDLPKFNKTYQSIILQLAEQRNSFIHYKWTRTSDFDIEKIQAVEITFLKKIKSAIAYVKRYETLILYQKNKSKLDKFYK
jgi:hypothetical protein